MIRKVIGLLALLTLVVYGLWGNNWSMEHDPYSVRPEISNASFAIHDNVVKISFDYRGVAGHIRDARMTLAIGVAVRRYADRLEHVHFNISGWKGLLWSSDGHQRTTRGTITALVELPYYCAINQNSEITGFGLDFFDALGRQARPVFIEGRIIHETRIARLFRLIKEALT